MSLVTGGELGEVIGLGLGVAVPSDDIDLVVVGGEGEGGAHQAEREAQARGIEDGRRELRAVEAQDERGQTTAPQEPDLRRLRPCVTGQEAAHPS